MEPSGDAMALIGAKSSSLLAQIKRGVDSLTEREGPQH